MAPYDCPVALLRCFQQAEGCKLPSPCLMDSQYGTDCDKRSVVVDWLVEVAQELHFQDQTLFLATHLFDRILWERVVGETDLQIFGLACMWIASKYTEQMAPTGSQLVCFFGGDGTLEHLLATERSVLEIFQFKINIISSLDILDSLLMASATAMDRATTTFSSSSSLCSLPPSPPPLLLATERSVLEILQYDVNIVSSLDILDCLLMASATAMVRPNPMRFNPLLASLNDSQRSEASSCAQSPTAHSWTSSSFQGMGSGAETDGDFHLSQASSPPFTWKANQKLNQAMESDEQSPRTSTVSPLSYQSCQSTHLTSNDTPRAQSLAQATEQALTSPLMLKLTHYAKFYCEVALMDHRMGHWKSFQIASAALLLAHRQVGFHASESGGDNWPTVLQDLVGYSAESLRPVVACLEELQLKCFTHETLNAVYLKYNASEE
eukprot:gene30347-35351_t